VAQKNKQLNLIHVAEDVFFPKGYLNSTNQRYYQRSQATIFSSFGHICNINIFWEYLFFLTNNAIKQRSTEW